MSIAGGLLSFGVFALFVDQVSILLAVWAAAGLLVSVALHGAAAEIAESGRPRGNYARFTSLLAGLVFFPVLTTPAVFVWWAIHRRESTGNPQSRRVE